MPVHVSLIATVEQYSSYFRRLLSSIDEQTLQEIELIVVSSARDERIEQEMSLFRKKVSAYIEMERGTPLVSMMIQGIQRARGNYIVFCNDRFFFESFAMETFHNQICERNLEIFQFQINIIAEDGVTDDQVHMLADRYALSQERLAGAELLLKGYGNYSISPRMEGKIFRRELLERALALTDEFGGYHSEALWIYAALNCNAYQGGGIQKCANLVLRAKDVLAVSESEFHSQLEKKKMCDSISRFLKSSQCKMLSQEQKQAIAEIVNENAIKDLVKLWGSHRFPEQQRGQAAKQILKTWGARDMLCALAMWLPSSRTYNCRYLLELFPRTAKTKYQQLAVFGDDWQPCEDMGDLKGLLKGKWIRFSSGEQQSGSSCAETIVTLPDEKDNHFIYSKFDNIVQAIAQYNIDVVLFKNQKVDNLFDILVVLSCGAHVILDDRDVVQLLPIYRQNNASSYMDYVLPMLFANVVILSAGADVSHFSELGICYVYEDNIGQTIEEALGFVRQPLGTAGNLYLEQLLRRKYYQELAKAQLTLRRFRYVVGPYSEVFFRNISIQRIRKGIRSAIWRDRFATASLLEKSKMLVKTGLRLLGFKNFSIGIQNYHPKPRATFRQQMQKIRARARLLLHGKELWKRLKKKHLWAVAREKRLSPGKENPDKTFYLIRLNPGNEGLLLSYLRLLRELERLDKTKLVPVIDMQWTFYVMAHNNKSEKGRINGWERYFRPVAGYTLAQAYRSQNVIRGQLCYREQVDNYFRNNIMKENTPEAEQEFRRWCRVDHKYMGLREELRAEYERECEEILGGKRTIGVMIREGYSVLNKLNYALIANHAVQPEMEAVISDVIRLIDEWNCEQVFVSAEYVQTIDAFQRALGDKVVFSKRARKNFDANDAEEYRNKREDFYKSIAREQINYDYLKEVYLLSKCTCLLAGRASASIVAALWNNGKYEHRYIYDLGTYTVSNTTPIVTLEEQQ